MENENEYRFGEMSRFSTIEMEYQQRVQRLQNYVPFLKKMIEHLEGAKDRNREAQLTKMRSLLNILTDSNKKLRLETIQRCEEVLQKLYSKVEGAFEWSSGLADEHKLCLDMDRFNVGRYYMKNYSGDADSPLLEISESLGRDGDGGNPWRRRSDFEETPRSPSPPASVDVMDIPKPVTIPMERRDPTPNPIIIPLERKKEPVMIPLQRREESLVSKPVIIPLERKEDFESKWYEDVKLPEPITMRSNYGALNSPTPCDSGINPYCSFMQPTKVSHDSPPHKGLKRADIPKLEEMRMNRKREEYLSFEANTHTSAHERWPQEYSRRPSKESDSPFEGRRAPSTMLRPGGSPRCTGSAMLFDYDHGQYSPHTDLPECTKEPSVEQETEKPVPKAPSGQRASIREKLALEINKVHRVGVSTGGALRTLSKDLTSPPLQRTMHGVEPFTRRISGGTDDESSKSTSAEKEKKGEKEKTLPDKPSSESSSFLGQDANVNKSEGKDENNSNSEDNSVLEEFSFKRQHMQKVLAKQRSGQSSNAVEDRVPAISKPSEDDDEHNSAMSICDDDSDNGTKIPFLDTVHELETPVTSSPIHSDPRISSQHISACNSSPILQPFINPSMSNVPQGNQEAIPQRNWAAQTAGNSRGYPPCYQANMVQQHVSSPSTAPVQLMQLKVTPPTHLVQQSIGSPNQPPANEPSHGLQSHFMGLGDNYAHVPLVNTMPHRRPPLLPAPTHTFRQGQMSENGHNWSQIQNNQKGGLLPHPNSRQSWSYSRHNINQSVPESRHASSSSPDIRSHCGRGGSWNTRRGSYAKVNDPRLRNKAPSRPPDSKYQWKHPADPRRASPVAPETKKPLRELQEEKEEISSPLDFLYVTEEAPKTGKGYGFQKFRIPKLKNREPKKEEPISIASSAPQLFSSAPNDEKNAVEKKPKVESEMNKEKEEAVARSKEELTKELFETLLKVSFSSAEGTKILENSKFIEELREKLNLNRPKKSRPIIVSDSESEVEEKPLKATETGRKKSRRIIQSSESESSAEEKEDPKTPPKPPESKRPTRSCRAVKQQSIVEMFGGRPRTRSQRKLFSVGDEDSREEKDEKKKGDEGDDESEEGEDDNVFQDAEKEETRNEDVEEEMKAKPPARRTKRRSPLELLQEDIREMFICEGVMSANGFRMCRLLKEAAGVSNPTEDSSFENELSKDSEYWEEKPDQSLKDEKVCDNSDDSADDADVKKTTNKKGKAGLTLQPKVCLKKTNSVSELSEGNQASRRGRNCARRSRRKPLNAGNRGPSCALSLVKSIAEESEIQSGHDFESEIKHKEDQDINLSKDVETDSEKSKEAIDSEPKSNVTPKTIKVELGVAEEENQANMDLNEDEQTEGQKVKVVVTTNGSKENQRDVIGEDQELEERDVNVVISSNEKDDENEDTLDKKSQRNKKKVNRKLATLPLKKENLEKKGIDNSSNVSDPNTESYSSKNSFKTTRDTNLVDISYYSNGVDAISCKLCSYNGKQIVGHYITKHPDSEILVSRLSEEQAKIAWIWNENHKGPIRFSQEHSTSLGPFVCLICETFHNGFVNFFDHVTTHTGEYRYNCNYCSYRSFKDNNVRSHAYYVHQKKWGDVSFAVTPIEEIVKAKEIDSSESSTVVTPGLLAHLCSKCNYVQISENQVEKHIATFHKEGDIAKVLKIDLSLIAPEPTSVCIPDDTSEMDELSQDISASQDTSVSQDTSERVSVAAIEIKNNLKEKIPLSCGQDNEIDGNSRETRTEEVLKSIKQEKVDPEEHCDINANLDEKVFIIDNEASDDPQLFNKSKEVWDEVLEYPEFDEEIRIVALKLNVRLEDDEPKDTEFSVLNVKKEKVEEDGKKDEAGNVKEMNASEGVEVGVEVKDKENINTEEERKEECNSQGKKDEVAERRKLSTNLHHTLDIEVIDIDDDSDEESDSDYSSDSDSSSGDDGIDCKIINELPKKDNLFTLDMIPEVKVITKIADITSKVADQIKQKKSEDQHSMIKEAKEDDVVSEIKVGDGDQEMKMDIPHENSESEEKNPEKESPPKFKIRVRNLSGDRLSSSKKPAVDSNTSEADPYIDVIGNSPIFESDADNTLCQISSVCSLHPNEQVPEDFIKAVSENETPDLKQLAAYDTGPSSGSVYYIAPSHFQSLPSTESFHATGISMPVSGLNSQRLYPYPASTGMSPPGFRKILPAPVINPPVLPQSFVHPQAFSENSQSSGVSKSSTFQEQTCSQNGKVSRNEGVAPWTNSSGEGSVVSPASNQSKVCSIMRASLYAKASKTPAVFNQVLNNQMKLCHLFKCMGRQCSFTTDEPVIFLSHYLGHESLESGAASSTGPSLEGEVEKQERKFDWQQCCYCAEMFSSGSSFVKHVQSEHGECIFQCPYCFYRAAAVSYVILHQNSTHITEKVSVLHCEAPGKCRKEAPPIKPNIEAYVCYQGNCKRSFYSPSKYLSHLQIEHSAVSIYCCHKCSYQCLKADRLLQHYKFHSFYLYQCVYCEQGSDTSEEILQHLASFHPNKRATVCKRNSQMTSNGSARTSGRHVYILYEDIELTEMDDVDVVPAGSSSLVGTSTCQAEEEQKTNNNSNESQKESEDGNSDDDNLIIAEDAEDTPVKVNLQRLEDESEIVELSGSDMDEDIPVIDSEKLMDSRADDSMEGESDVNLLNSQLEISQDQQEVDTSQMSDLHVVFTHSNAEELEMLGKGTDVAEGQKDSSNNDDIIEVDGDKEVCENEKSPKIDDGPKGVERERDKRLRRARIEQKSKEDYSNLHSNKKNTSSRESANSKIDRPNLYVCCFSGCSYLAKDVFQLKHHLRDCPQGKDCHHFACPHCNRTYKHLPYLLKHYRVHGKKVFVCMVCKYQGSYANTAIQHVKARHRATTTTVSPLIDWQEPDDIPVNTKDQKLIVVAPKEVSQSFLLRKRFLPEDADYLPFPCVYNREAKCARCSYSSKIRSNMRRHLHLHLKFSLDLHERMALTDSSDPNQVPWSDKDIVNPMPCLETKEMMFDKMTNWAISSHLDDNIKEEEVNDGRRDSVASNYEEDNFIPRFVPENERYVCGVIGCHYQTVDDTMLRHHLRALHREETFFRCAHCPDDPKLVHQVPVDRLAAHLKMHDDRLYQCIHCNYYHFQRRFVERHIMDKHTEMSQMVNVIREPETVIKLPSSSGTSGMAGTSANGSIRSSNPSQGDGGVEEDNLWHCSLCSYSCTNRESISDHARISHSICSQYICGMCPFRSAYLSSFNPHFSIKHLGYPVQLIANYFRHNISAFASPSITIILPNGKVIHPPNPMSSKSDPRSEPVIEVWPYVEKGFGKSSSSSVRLKELNTTYPWQRCMPKVRYLRGIPIADEGEEIMYDLAESLKLNDDKEGDDASPATEGNAEESPLQESMILDEVQIVEVEESDLTVLDHTNDAEMRLSLKRRKSDAESSSSDAALTEGKRKIDQGKATDLVKSVASKKPLPEDQPAPAKVLKIMSPEARFSTKAVAMKPEEEKSTQQSSKENDLKTKSIGDNEALVDLRKQFGDFGRPVGSFFMCPKCRHKSKNKCDMRDHLFRELNYKRYVCTHCGLMAPAKSNLQKHYLRVHQKDGKPEAIATLPPDKNVELWVHHMLAAQLSLIRQFQLNAQINGSDNIDELETVVEAKSSSFKTPSGEGACKVFFSCKFCTAKFTTIRGLKIHVKNYHFKMGSWICGHCDVTANNQVIISKHSKFSHPNKEELVVSNTLGAFMTNKFWEDCGLLAHMGLESGEAALSNPQCSIFKCSSCNYQTNKLDDIEQHKLKHSTLRGGKSEFGASEDGVNTSDTPNQSQVESEKAKMRMEEEDSCTKDGLARQESNDNAGNDVELLDEALLDEDVLITMENKSEYGKSSPLYVFKCYYCRMKSPSCDEVFNHWEYVHHKPASGIRRLRLFKCRRLSIVNQENCNPPRYHCAYCGVDGSLLQLKEHCSAKHSDCEFKVGNVNNTAFYCLICSYFCNSSATLSNHFESVHPGQKPLYEVKNMENKTGAVSSLEAGKLLDDKDERSREEEFLKNTLYRCYWCNEEFSGLKFVQVHHNKKHGSFPLKYLIELKATRNIETIEKPGNTEAVFHCPSCSFSSKSYPILFNHLRGHQLPFKCGNCEFKAEFPSKISEHHLIEHPLIPCPTIHSDMSAEFELSKLWKQVKLITGTESTTPQLKRPASSPLASEPKRLCAVARKSTTCVNSSPIVQKATARKSTNPSASFIKNLKNLKESSSDEESASDESLPIEGMLTGSYFDVISPAEEFSYYNGGKGQIKSSVDLSQITVWMTFGGCAAKRVQVSKMAQLVDLSPQLIIKDIGLRLKD